MKRLRLLAFLVALAFLAVATPATSEAIAWSEEPIYVENVGALYEPSDPGIGTLTIANAAGSWFNALNSRGEIVCAGSIPTNFERLMIPNCGPDSVGVWVHLVLPQGVLNLEAGNWEWMH